MNNIKVLLILLGFSAQQLSASEGYQFSFKVTGVQDTIIFLAGYYGAKQYYKDTAQVDAKGNFVFEGEEDMPGGIYSIVMPDKKAYFEFIVNEQKFHMETDRNDLINKMKVKGSGENELFYDYLKFINEQQKIMQPLRNKLKSLQEEEDKKKKNQKEIKELKEKLSEVDNAVKNYKLNIINNHKETLLAKIFSTSQDPEIPEEITNNDSISPYRYFKEHYFDGVDFSDERLLRTPVLHNKVQYYMKKLTAQQPDSVIKSADYLVPKARANKEVFKFVVHYITNTYETSKIMGMDAVFVHMAENYYLTGEAFWADSAQKAKISERAMTLKPLLVGKKTPNVILPDTAGKWHNLHKISAKYTILYFWDSSCGHCKKETPKLKKLYEKYRNQDVEVYAVGTEFENKDWIKYIKKNKLEWINVSDNPEINKNAVKYLHLTTLESLNFRDTYDIFSTPQVYLLDKDKKIVAKRLGVEQLDKLLETLLKDGSDKKAEK